MPLYDYRCESCGDFRAIRPMAESGSPGVCPTCGASAVRVIATPYLAGKDTGGTAPRPGGHGVFPRACGHGPGCSHSHG